ncbi:serine/threonine-protein phosphatase [Bengtsoniella intestinalis]|uniref:PP2C family protein-serine/threonine phosphatase n=1 Tax=Bengtsoniella intestinalis TaxID=3073143 RepID=UPI00391EE65A
MEKHISAWTERGEKPCNQDFVALQTKTYRETHQFSMQVEGDDLLAVVCDGISQGSQGEVAAALVAQTLCERFAQESAMTTDALLAQLDACNDAVVHYYHSDAFPCPQMGGTTLAALYITQDNCATVCNIGDSGIYILRDGQFCALYQEHTLAGEQQRQGQPYDPTVSNMLTQFLGNPYQVGSEQAYTTVLDLLPGDKLLLCSDGVSKTLPEDQLIHILTTQPADKVAKVLVDTAVGTAHDNVTALVITIGKKTTTTKRLGLVHILLRCLRRKPKDIEKRSHL